jgi:hypothetical protein
MRLVGRLGYQLSEYFAHLAAPPTELNPFQL